MEKNPGNPIQRVSHRTGLSPHVIRIWEKRYQAVVPQRSATNRRFYGEEDIQRLRLLKELTDSGLRIGNIARLSLGELRELQETRRQLGKVDATEFPMDHGSIGELVDSCLEAIEHLDAPYLLRCFSRANVMMAPLTIIENLMVPLLMTLGERWRQGSLRIVHGQFAAGMIRPFLVGIGNVYGIDEHAPHLVTATPEGQLHEFGALFANSAAASSGWRATYLGRGLPAEEIAAGVLELKVKFVGLSLLYPKNDATLHQDLLQLRRHLPPEVKIIAGGSGAGAYARSLEMIGAVRLSNLMEFQAYLDAVSLESPAPSS